MVDILLRVKKDLHKDKEERRRERIVAHLIEAYRNLETAACRQTKSKEQMDKIESSTAAIFLFGTKEAAEKTTKFGHDLENGQASLNELLKVLRKDLRNELGLEQHNVDTKFIRFE